jgi:DNA-binding NtrC family response regulator
MTDDRKPHLLVVDDYMTTAQVLKSYLEKAGYSVTTATSGKQALEEVNKHFVDLLVLDELIPDMNGSRILQKCRERFHAMGAVFVTGNVECLQNTLTNVVGFGAYGLVFKGNELEQKLVAKVREVLEKTELSRANRLSHHTAKRMVGNTAIIGSNPTLLKALDDALAVAPTDTYVLLRGETGTGKDLIAKYIHEHSPRSLHPFTLFNVNTLTNDLMGSTLFGSRKGGFTGADKDIKGMFELEDVGTLFLNEIGHLPSDLQPKHLTALERHKYESVQRQQ